VQQTVRTLIKQISQYQRPAAVLIILRGAAAVPNDRFFNDPVFKPLLEAWAAATFAHGLESLFGPAEVRLDPDRFPDFRLRQNEFEHEFEITTAEKPERRRGAEHKERAKNPLLLTPYEPARGQQEGPEWVATAVQRKYEKHYSATPHLLVYANFEANSLDPLELANACAQWAVSFSSIWILWEYKFVQLFDSEAFGKTDRIWQSVGLDPREQG